jgi:hypothetical protein
MDVPLCPEHVALLLLDGVASALGLLPHVGEDRHEGEGSAVAARI